MNLSYDPGPLLCRKCITRGFVSGSLFAVSLILATIEKSDAMVIFYLLAMTFSLAVFIDTILPFNDMLYSVSVLISFAAGTLASIFMNMYGYGYIYFLVILSAIAVHYFLKIYGLVKK